MKQKLLMLCLTLGALTMLGFSSPLAQPLGQESEYFEAEYEDERPYISENGYAYDDAYSSVDWDNLYDDDLYYSYYDDENVFMVVVGRRIYIVPYDFFYYRIWPRHRSHFRYCHYDYFSDWWGIPFYNRIWYRYHSHSYRYYNHGYRYSRYHNFYRDHYRRPRVVIHKDGWRAPSSRNRFDGRSRSLQHSRTYRDRSVLYRSGDSRISSSRSRTSASRRVISPRRSSSSSSASRSTRSRSSTSSSRARSSSSSSRSRSSRSSSSSSRSSSSGSSSKGTAVKKK